MYSRRLWPAWLVAAVAVMMLVGCSSQPKPPGPAPVAPAKPAAPAAQAAKEFKIGLIEPMSGSSGLVGADIRDGMLMAVEDIKAAGGIKALGGASITVVVGNSEGKNDVTKLAAERLVNQDKVHALAGAFISGNTLVLSDFAQENKIPLIVPNPVAQSLRAPERTYTYPLSPGSTILAIEQTKFITALKATNQNLPKTSIVWEDTAWGTETSKVQEPKFKEIGVNLVGNFSLSTGAPDLNPIASRIIAAQSELVVTTVYPNDNITLLRALDGMGAMKKLNYMGVAGALIVPAVMALGPSVTDNLMAITWWSPDLKKPGVAELTKKFKDKYNKDLNANSAHGYAAAWILKEAAEKAGSTERDALKKALDSLELPASHPAMAAMAVNGGKFDAAGQFTAQPIIMQYQDQKWVTVWPESMAASKVRWKK